MVKGNLKVVWDEEAKAYLKQAIAYIKKDSPQNADKVKKAILTSTKALTAKPQRLHAPDKYRINNDGSYRAYELHRFRISSSRGMCPHWPLLEKNYTRGFLLNVARRIKGNLTPNPSPKERGV